MKKKYIIAISGASGSIYASCLLKFLAQNSVELHIIISPVAKQVWGYEMNETWQEFIQKIQKETTTFIYNNNDLSARVASGSFRHNGMVVIPCSMKTVSGIANGYASSLIERASDICLKENFPLLLVVRETPFSLIHLRNMTQIAEAGGQIIPASPSFYHGENNYEGLINFMVGKVLDAMGIDNKLFNRWKYEPQN